MPGNVGHMTPRWQTAGTYESAGESQRFSSISAQGLSTNFTSHFVRFLWARERTYSRALTWLHSGYLCSENVSGEHAMHVVLKKKA